MRRRTVLLLLSVGLSVLASELLLRHWVPQWSVFYPPTNFRPDLFEEAPFGYRLRPGRVMVYPYPRHRPRRVTVHSNREGFRNRRDLSERDDRTRIVVLGDSMVFGSGIEEEERFTEVLEKAHPTWRVDNLGMVGFGTDLMLRSLEAVALDPPPRVVVLSIFTDDLRRVVPQYAGMGFRLPRYELVDGSLRTIPYPEPRIWDHSRILQGTRYALWRYTTATFLLNEAILDRFAELAARTDFVLVVMFLPPRQPRWDDGLRRSFIQDWARRKAIPFLDLTTPIAAGGGEKLFLVDDGHLNPEGHQLVAMELSRFLVSTGVP